MGPSLRVLVSSDSTYPPSKPISVNSAEPTKITTSNFTGEISVWIKDFQGDNAGGDGSAYFSKRSNMTYAIVARGKYLDDPTGEDVVFGNVFERPIKDSLPWGTSVAVKFMNWVDPTLELDIYADKPWALSPAVAGMSQLAVGESEASAWVEESSGSITGFQGGDEKGEIGARMKYFRDPAHRKSFKYDQPVSFEFANGLLDFNTLSATLPPPFHLNVPLLRYWDGQPVMYVCRRKSKNPVSKDGVYWSLAFEIVDEEAKAELEKRGGKVFDLQTEAGGSHGETSVKGQDTDSSDPQPGVESSDID